MGLVLEAHETLAVVIEGGGLEGAQRALNALLNQPSTSGPADADAQADLDANADADAPPPTAAARINRLSKSGRLFASDLDQFRKQLESDQSIIEEALRGLDDDEGYEVVRDDEFQIKYRNKDGDPIHSLKCSVDLEAPVWEMMAICREVRIGMDRLTHFTHEHGDIYVEYSWKAVFSLFFQNLLVDCSGT